MMTKVKRDRERVGRRRERERERERVRAKERKRDREREGDRAREGERESGNVMLTSAEVSEIIGPNDIVKNRLLQSLFVCLASTYIEYAFSAKW
jgi:hypothetical protein